MGWLKNTAISLDNLTVPYYHNAKNRCTIDLYRSRITIDTNMFRYANMVFQLPNLPENVQYSNLMVHTYAMPRSSEDSPVILDIWQNYLTHTIIRDDAEYGYYYHNLFIFNTSSNQAIVPAVINLLTTEHGFENKDYRTALTCTPFHNVSVLHKDNITIVFSNVYDDTFILKLGAVLPLLYNLEVPETLLNTYLIGDKAEFNKAYLAAIKPFENNRIQKEMLQALDNMATSLLEGETAQLDLDIARHQSEVQDYEMYLKNAYLSLQDLLIKKASTFWQETETYVKDFIEYIKTTALPSITKLCYSRGQRTLDIALISKLRYWNPEYFQRYLESARSNCVTTCNANMKALLKNIFIDNVVQVTFHTGIRIDFKNKSTQINKGYVELGTSPCGLAHPHLYHHDCWGDNRSYITKAFNKKDYIVLWEQIKSVVSGINLLDTTVFSEFINDLKNYTNIPYLTIIPTGETLTVSDFIHRYPEGYVVPVEQQPVTTTAHTRRNRTIPEGEIHELQDQEETEAI
jgi:hypothetical protein